MKKYLLISSPMHPGINAVGLGYKRAFQFLGEDFDYLDYLVSLKPSISMVNALIQHHLLNYNYENIIIIQPTFLNAQTLNVLSDLKNRKKFRMFSVATEDPYSLSAIFNYGSLFNIKFTNEKKVSDLHAYSGFRYLPTAFDSFQLYKKAHGIKYDLTMLVSFYKNRIEYLEKIKNLKCRLYYSGNIGWAVENKITIETTGFKSDASIVPRYKEYELYDSSLFVLNPHRHPSIMGKHTFHGQDIGIECQYMMKEAVSPNPRFFDSIGCGAIPLCDVERTECINIVSKYCDVNSNNIDFFKLPKIDDVGSIIDLIDRIDKENFSNLYNLKRGIIENESYLNRAQTLIDDINA